MSAGYLPVEGFFPGEGCRTFLLAQAKLDHFLKAAHKTYFNALSIPEVLKAPAIIFQGLEREDHENGLCYCGIPSKKYHDESITVPPPPGFTFAIFINSANVIFEWRWEKIDASCSQRVSPEGFQERFAKILWKH